MVAQIKRGPVQGAIADTCPEIGRSE